MDEFPEMVTDVRGGEHYLKKLLGKGGQGGVYSTRNPDLVVKFVAESAHETREQLEKKLLHVRLLRGKVPMLADLPVAMPLEMLRAPHIGYVMRLLSGMTPIAHMIHCPPEVESPPQWYLQAGGLRRRLRLLAHVAEVLAGLHALSLVYVDTSDNNVFVSEEIGGDAAWLIDADNLAFETRPGTNFLATPWFPRLRSSGSVPRTTLSDAFSFAVLAFMTLTLGHPLRGDLVYEGDEDVEKKAFAGKLPWIDHPDDASNRSTRTFPREIVLTKRLADLAHRCFGPGLNDPLQRPRGGLWAEALHAAADITVKCSQCEATYYVWHTRCDWCDTPRPPSCSSRFAVGGCGTNSFPADFCREETTSLW